MSAAPLPPDEHERLAILNRYAILDSLPEQPYDDLTFLASQICGTPISLLSLVDRDRQWFKSHHGIEATETPREMSFCAHAILGQGVMQVPDTACDARFADNALVSQSPKIRFYAGAPLVTSDGFSLGTLCVIDHQPRLLTPEQIRSLEALARQAVSQMELWRSFRRFEIAGVERGIALSVAEETMTRLTQVETRFRQFMDNSPVVAFIKDERGRYLYLNAPMERTFGISLSQLRGRNDFAWLPAEVAEAVRNNDQQVLDTAQTVQTVETVPTPDGCEREWLTFKFPIAEASGARLLGGVALDVTEQRRSERLKSEFISVVSHELRTPLTSIRGALGLLAGGVAGEISAQARQMIDIAQKNGDRLGLLINDILDIEKIESGQMRFEMHPVGLAAWLRDSVEQNRGYGEPLGVAIQIETPETLREESPDELRILADTSRLDQVLSNLLSNACKWTPRGGTVHVRAEVRGERALISVRDEGPGVPPEFVPRLFEKFGQADSSSTRQQGGTGLGLAISRAIMEKLGGRLEYLAPSADETAAGETGATFRFDVALCQPVAAEVSANLAESARAGQILICEDDPEVAELLATVAGQNGYGSAIAGTLAEARGLLLQQRFCGATLDLTLPDGDGIDWLRELREAGNDLPVVVVSATAREGQLRGEALQVLDWLDKPLDPCRLLAALDDFGGAEGACLLHVEDDADVRRVVAAILGPGTRIVAATTLAQARAQLARRRFDLVILDLSFRDGNGLDLVRELGATVPPTPAILFSAQEPTREQGHLFAASLVKSRAHNDELRDTIHRFLSGEQETRKTQDEGDRRK